MNNRRFSNKNELITEELEYKAFNEFLDLNPNKGKPYEDWKIDDGQSLKVKLYSWMTIDGREYSTSVKFLQFRLNELCKVKINNQIYYDIIVLGLTSIEDRPKCVVCGGVSRFSGFGKRTYLKTCSETCKKELRDKEISKLGKSMLGKPKNPESVRKQVEAHKGWIPTAEYRMNKSRSMRKFYKTDKGKELRAKFSRTLMNRNINERKNLTYYKNRSGNFNSGIYHSNEFNKDFGYDSSWELNFIKFFEQKNKLKDIEIFDRCMDDVGYYQTDGTFHRYLPDFFIKFKSGLKIVIEIKPENILKNDSVTLSKRIAAKKYFRKKNIKYIILTENELYSTKHKKYSKIFDTVLGIKNSFNIYDYIV